MLTALLQVIINGLGLICSGISHLMIGSPFRAIAEISLSNDILGFINWIVPVSEIVSVLELWVAAIVVFYAYSAIMRFAKAIQ